MTLEDIESRVSAATSTAINHVDICKKLIESGGLKAAIEHCIRQRIDPPQCSLTAASANADRLRGLAAKKLTDPKWWKKSLETSALRGYEAEQLRLGNVRNFISDGLAAYTQKHKSKR